MRPASATSRSRGSCSKHQQQLGWASPHSSSSSLLAATVAARQHHRKAGAATATAAAAARRTQEQSPACRAAAAGADVPSAPAAAAAAICIDLNALVQGLEPLVTAWALAAAKQLPGSELAGGWQLYTPALAQLLPALSRPSDAALVARLLCEEGMIAARSTPGREGRVVGRAVRHSGSRPLLVMEVMEHWQQEIRPTCLLRWTRALEQQQQLVQGGESGSSSSSSGSAVFERLVQDSWLRAQQSLVPWRVVNVQQQECGSSSSSSSSRRGSSSSAQIPPAAAASSSGAAVAGEPVSAAAAGAAIAVLDSPATAADGPDAATVTCVVQPWSTSVLQSIRSCSAPCYVASTYPQAVTHAALAALQLHVAGSGSSSSSSCHDDGGGVQVLHGTSMQECVQRFAAAARQHQQQQSSRPDSRPGELLMVLSSPNLLEDDASSHHQDQQQQQQQQQAGAALQLQVAEWACRPPSLRAKALASPNLGLLSECGLAERLQTDCLDVVMDGIAWR